MGIISLGSERFMRLMIFMFFFGVGFAGQAASAATILQERNTPVVRPIANGPMTLSSVAHIDHDAVNLPTFSSDDLNRIYAVALMLPVYSFK